MNNDKNEENFPLDEICIQKIAQADQLASQIAREAVLQANAAINGMLSYFLAKHGLEGQWRLADNRRELVLDRTPAPNRQ